MIVGLYHCIDKFNPKFILIEQVDDYFCLIENELKLIF